MAPPDASPYGVSPRTRSHSISSDKPSVTGYGGITSPPVATSPEPAFIAASAASQIVTNDHDSQADVWLDQHGIEPSGETALVAPPALKLVNRFLDQLLFNFLSISRSTSLASLRPAVSDVLKQKLAREAISGADQELHEYLGGGDDEELLAFHNGLEPSGDWDLELVWKRTRLRCMVYSSLGDMEEEDEDFYTEQEQLDGPPGHNNRFSNNPGVVSPAVAIFLTSILEYMGEQVLVVAGQAAYHRLRSKHDREDREGTSVPSEIADRVVVEESDVERAALDRTLGRLWRGWKKRIRSPTTSISMPRSFSRESMRSPTLGGPDEYDEEEEQPRMSISAVADLTEDEYAAAIPLPLPADDVREIEIPGLVPHSDDEDELSEEDEEHARAPQRPKSLMIYTNQSGDDMLTPISSEAHSPVFISATSRKRSYSLPSPAPSFYTSSSAKRTKADMPDNDGQDATEGTVGEPAMAQEAMDDSVEGRSGKSVEEGDENGEMGGSRGVVAGVIAGAAAIGAATVAGIAAAATGQPSLSQLEESVDEGISPEEEVPRGSTWGENHNINKKTSRGGKQNGDVAEEFIEEPQIMTSSRVSIGGRVSPEEQSRSVSRQHSARSPSVHSLRLIDVAPTKSPARSRHGSVDANDYPSARSALGSRPSSIYTPTDSQTPRVASPVPRVTNASPIARVNSAMSSRHAKSPAENFIAEEQQQKDPESGLLTAVPADFAAAMQGVDFNPSPISQTNGPELASKDVTSQPSTFVLSAPPGGRNSRGNAHASTTTQQSGSTLSANHNLSGHDHGVPPLTPLREMMEGAPDTSDEASSITPSYDAQSSSEYGVNGHTPTVSASSIVQNQRSIDPPRSVRPLANTTQRTSPPRSSQQTNQRPTHTSRSASGSSAASNKFKPVRTSDEELPSGVADKSRSFEQLIRSDQTIQYTLTPQNIRNIEGLPDSPASPRFASASNAPGSPRFASASNVPSSPRFAPVPPTTLSQDTPRPPSVNSPSPTVNKTTGLHSNPAEVPKVTKATKSTPANSGSKLRPNAPQPRDARVNRESMGDLAEFIASTAPPGSYDETTPRGSPAVSSHKIVQGVVRRPSASVRSGSGNALPHRSGSSAGRPKLQAREAAVSRGETVSDLIDFVRSGPQLEANQRISRAGDTLTEPRYSQTSNSVNSSVNSQSALLNKTTKPPPAHNSRSFGAEEDMMPKRKTRRVRDMYQIDFSDEEDEEEYEAQSRPTPIKEESLAEFLASVPPPPESPPVPFYDVGPKSSAKLKKKASSPSILSRFSRRDSTGSIPSLPQHKSSGGQDSRSIASRGTSHQPPIPTHSPASGDSRNKKPTAYEPARSNNHSQIDSGRTKVQQKSYQPREAIYTTSRTNDLADFLRSEPPSGLSNQPQTFAPTLQKEDSGPFQRMFGRKRVQ